MRGFVCCLFVYGFDFLAGKKTLDRAFVPCYVPCMEAVLEEGLVSLISPCYNVAKYLPRFFDSLLQQTYDRLHVILIDDGSTDETWDVIERYVPLLKARGYEVDTIRQSNQGQSVALQVGLQYVKGEFFSWPDPDDFLFPDSISRRVAILRSQPDDVALVRCNAVCIREEDDAEIGYYMPAGQDVYVYDRFFRDVLLRKTFLGAMCCLAKTRSFLDINPAREIYTRKDAGQNWQLLLPLGYHFRTVETSEVLCGYLVRSTSHSQKMQSYEQRIAYENMCDTVVLETLFRMGLAGSKWERQAHALSVLHCYRIACRCQRPQMAEEYLRELKTLGFSARCVARLYSLCAQWGKSHWNENPQSYLNRGLSWLGIACLPPY